MVQKCIMGSSGGGETVEYDYSSYSAYPNGTVTIPITDGMVTVAPGAYESSQFEGCWYVKQGVMTKIYQNSSPKTTVTYSDGTMTIKNNTSGYYINAWVYSEV